MSTRASEKGGNKWLYNLGRCFGHCYIASILGSNLWFLVCFMNSESQTEHYIYLLQLILHFENW